jgi:hypothetical protein
MRYQDFISRKQREYGDKFDSSKLNPDFIDAFNTGDRITVDFGYETKRGTIGVTTGWVPAFLLMLTSRSIGSSHIIRMDSKIIGGKR